jgi:hypothetical protein
MRVAARLLYGLSNILDAIGRTTIRGADWLVVAGNDLRERSGSGGHQ